MASVLIVEDDASLRELLAMMLEGEGLSVETAANGKEALEVLARRPPGVILLDMRMPIMDGWQFCREMDRRGGRRPAVVVVTAATDPATRAREVRADAWLSKPFDRETLVALIHRMVRKSGAPSEATIGGRRDAE
ncbi:MAG TPA: response regulator [Labilithrix sp.]|jgi:CheY-like chemotaxis protein|nr:response regulator [Labilithrix sp.]